MNMTLGELRRWFDAYDMPENTVLHIDDDGASLCADAPGSDWVRCIEIGAAPQEDN